MSEGEDRDVLFRVGIEEDPGAVPALDDLATHVSKTQEAMLEGATKVSKGVRADAEALASSAGSITSAFDSAAGQVRALQGQLGKLSTMQAAPAPASSPAPSPLPPATERKQPHRPQVTREPRREMIPPAEQRRKQPRPMRLAPMPPAEKREEQRPLPRQSKRPPITSAPRPVPIPPAEQRRKQPRPMARTEPRPAPVSRPAPRPAPAPRPMARTEPRPTVRPMAQPASRQSPRTTTKVDVDTTEVTAASKQVRSLRGDIIDLRSEAEKQIKVKATVTRDASKSGPYGQQSQIDSLTRSVAAIQREKPQPQSKPAAARPGPSPARQPQASSFGRGMQAADKKSNAQAAKEESKEREANIRSSLAAHVASEKSKQAAAAETAAKQQAVGDVAFAKQKSRFDQETRFTQRTKQSRKSTIQTLEALQKKYYASGKKQSSDALKSMLTDLKAQDREAERLHKRRRRRQLSTAHETRRAQDISVKSQLRGLRELSRERDAAATKAQSTRDALAEQYSSVGESLMRATRGFTILATAAGASSVSIEQLVRKLAIVQGAFDATAGTVNVLVKASRLIRTFRDAQTAATAATVLASKASAAQSAALARETTAATSSAAAAHGRLAAARRAGAASGAVSVASASAPAAGAAAAGGATLGGGLVAAGVAAAAALGSVAVAGVAAADTMRGIRDSGFGGGVRQKSVSNIIATGEVKTLGWMDRTAEKVGLGGLQGGTDMARNLIPGLGPAMKQYRSTSAGVERAEQRRLEGRERVKAEREKEERNQQEGAVRAGRFTASHSRDIGLLDSTTRLREMSTLPDNTGPDKLIALQRRLEAAQSQPAEQGSAGIRQQADITRLRRTVSTEKVDQSTTTLESQSKSNKISLVQFSSELGRAQQILADMRKSQNTTDAERNAAVQVVIDLHGRVRSIQEKGLQIEKETAKVKRQAIADSLAGINQEINLKTKLSKVGTTKLKPVKQSFGELKPLEKRRLLEIKRKADAIGESVLTPGDRGVLADIKKRKKSGATISDDLLEKQADIRDKQIRAVATKLPQKEREWLSTVDTGFTRRVRSAGAEMEADRWGFGAAFGKKSEMSEETREETITTESVKRLKAEFAVKHNVQIEIDNDIQESVSEVVNEVRASIAESNSELVQQVKDMIEKDKEEKRNQQGEFIQDGGMVMN